MSLATSSFFIFTSNFIPGSCKSIFYFRTKCFIHLIIICINTEIGAIAIIIRIQFCLKLRLMLSKFITRYVTIMSRTPNGIIHMRSNPITNIKSEQFSANLKNCKEDICTRTEIRKKFQNHGNCSHCKVNVFFMHSKKIRCIKCT